MIKATIKNIQSQKSIHIVEFDFNGVTLKMMSLELSNKIKIGTKVSLSIKSTQITIAKNITGMLSCSNKIRAKINHVDNGELLSCILLDINGVLLESIITASASKQMVLQKDDEVHVFIKASEISILEILDV
ncbi:TOBE domain-containing protein [Arcobacter sp. YIC-310]|uniref:TOBE domain-containing protein n=1 Tax=Arcobacter sp. YIC-310 TaxID=3376632 RepID=UPI003C1DABF2